MSRKGRFNAFKIARYLANLRPVVVNDSLANRYSKKYILIVSLVVTGTEHASYGNIKHRLLLLLHHDILVDNIVRHHECFQV